MVTDVQPTPDWLQIPIMVDKLHNCHPYMVGHGKCPSCFSVVTPGGGKVPRKDLEITGVTALNVTHS